MDHETWANVGREIKAELTLAARRNLAFATINFDRLTALVERAQGPMPESFSWEPWILGCARPTMSGTLLEMTLNLGDFGVYGTGARAETDRARVAALVALGRALAAKGAPLTSGLVEMSVDLSQQLMDSAGKLAACEAWGADKLFNGQKAASLCARGASWHGETGVAAWNWLAARGALNGAEKWKDCPQDLNPAVCSLKDRDWAGFKRAAEGGVALDWMDPSSGATLWHFACVGGHKMSKHALPILALRAPGLVNAQTRAAENFGEKAWAIAEGASALHCAVSELEIEAARCLLSLGANPNARDAKGRTPLHVLGNRWSRKAEAKAEPIVRLLVERGADAGLLDQDGRTAAQAMAAKAPLGALATLLAERPADVGGGEPAQKKALQALAARSDEKAIALGEEAALRVAVAANQGDGAKGGAPRKAAGRSSKRI